MSGNEELVLKAVERVKPDWISNAMIESKSGVAPHQQVFQITRKLMSAGYIEGEKRGGDWFFRATGSQPAVEAAPPPDALSPGVQGERACARFESRAREVLSSRLGVPLLARNLPNVPKKFDLVSSDGTFVGDAKYFDMVRGVGTPSAKFSIIAEHVWLLEKTNALSKFLVFGNNRRVPKDWLKKYGYLAEGVAFLFLDDDGELEVLADSSGAFT